MTTKTTLRRQAIVLLAVAMVAASAFTGSAVAASTTDLTVSIDDDDNTIAPGQTTTVEIAVANGDTGVGAAELGIALGDAGVAEITNVETNSAPTLSDNTIANDGQSADVRYFGVDTPDSGAVTFVEVTVQAIGEGTTSIDIVSNSQTGELAVFDELGAPYTLQNAQSASATLTVEDVNQPPTADAGSDQTVAEGATVTLDGSNSADPDAGDSLSYTWTELSSSGVSLSDADTATPELVAPNVDAQTTLQFELTVTDDDGESDSDTVSVTVTPVDEDAPTISGFDIAANGQDVDLTLTADEQLSTLEVSLGDDASGTLTLSDFSETDNGDGSYTYTADVSEGADGTYSATLQTAADGEGNDGAAGQSDSVTVSTQPPAGDKETTVSLQPADGQTAVGVETTYDVVVDNSDGGVGASELRISVADTDIASITDASVSGSAAQQITSGSNGQWVDIEYFGADTADSGPVTIATVTIEGTGAGTTSLSIGPAAGNADVLLFDEADGAGYDVTGTNDATIDVLPVQFLVDDSSLDDEPSKTAVGSQVTITAEIFSDGSVESTQPVELVFDVDGDGTMESIETQQVTIGPSGSTEVSFTVDVPADASFGDRAFEIVTPADVAAGTMEFTPPAVNSNQDLPNDLDGDGTYEDVNGDGNADAGDAQSLFANRDSGAVQSYVDAFDFNGDGAVNAGDAQALFGSLTD